MESKAFVEDCERGGAPKTPPLTEVRDGSRQPTMGSIPRHQPTGPGTPKPEQAVLLDWDLSPEDEDEEEAFSPIPPTPSVGSQEMLIAGNYEDSDQETFIAESSSGFSEDEEDPLSSCNMSETLLEDRFLDDFDLEPLSLRQDEIPMLPLPDYVGLEDVHSMLSIPEEQELHLDKSGNCITSKNNIQRASMQSIEMDAVAWGQNELLGQNTKTQDQEISLFEDSISMIPKSNKMEFNFTEMVSEKPPSTPTTKGLHRRHRSFITGFDFLENNKDPEFDENLTFEVSVIPNLDDLVLSQQPTKHKSFSSTKKTQEEDFRVPSKGCCPGFGSSPMLTGVRKKMQAFGKVLRKHWPIITSAVLPIVLIFTHRNKT